MSRARVAAAWSRRLSRFRFEKFGYFLPSCRSSSLRGLTALIRSNDSDGSFRTSGVFPPSFRFNSHVPHHDIGGNESAYGPIIGAGGKAVKDLLAWEQQCHSLFAVLAARNVIGTDELRRVIEALTPEQYEKWSYYEKWTAAMVTLLLEHGVITNRDLQRALFGSIQSEPTSSTPIFKQGDAVRVKKFLSDMEWKRPHIRTPGYIYGVSGLVERVCGRHGDPSFLAFGLEAPLVQLYRVRFYQRDIWPEQYDPETDHGDVVEVEVYEQWLESTSSSSGHSFEKNDFLFDHKAGDDCIHHHDHHHGDNQHNHHHDHVHEARPTVESRAIQREGAPSPGKELFQALLRLLIERSIVTFDDIRLMAEKMDTAFDRLDGASLVARAWVDPDFEARLLENAPAAAKELGINTSNPNAPTVLTVLKNTPTTHNLVVCTLCSCYPSGLLGIAPSWYKSREYRSRAVREPRRVLEEFGVSLPQETSIRVHDSTADHRYIVLPVRPKGTETWSEDDLRSLVGRDSMIGVAVPRRTA